jgi:hypothetical protein
MDKFGGIDLHSNNSVVVISDEADRVVYQRRLPNDLIQIRAAVAPYRKELVGVVVEATFYGRLGIMHGLSVIPRCDRPISLDSGCASTTVAGRYGAFASSSRSRRRLVKSFEQQCGLHVRD